MFGFSFWGTLLPLFLLKGTPLVVGVETSAPSRGQWMVSLRDEQGKVLQEWVVPVALEQGRQNIRLGDRAPGVYTLAIYLDANKNNRMDKGVLGQPLEPYAFSNNARALFSAPRVEDQRFKHPGGPPVLQVRL